jgi:hypothetical protein
VTVLVALGLGFVLASLVPADPGTFVLSGLSTGLVLAGLATFVGGFVYGSKKVRPLVQPRRIGVTVGLTAAAGRGITSVMDLLFVVALLGWWCSWAVWPASSVKPASSSPLPRSRTG